MKKKLITALITLTVLLALIIPSLAANDSYYMIDKADLLTDEYEQETEAFLKEISERQKFDVVIVTVDTLDGKTPEAYADDYFDYNGYGQGETHDGCLLLVSMEDRNWHISTTGYGITALTDAGLEYISDSFLSFLSDGDYYTAFTVFGEKVDEFVTQARTDTPYDVGTLPKAPREFKAIMLLVGLGTGALIALLVVSIQTSKLKSVAFKNEANEYLVDGSFVLTGSGDRYIRSDVVKTARPQESSGSGGSSTHTGSSGTTHGGAGGSF